jgi:hypothetical protein
MGRWTPQDKQPVGSNEHIGRRLFDEPKLFGATDQNPFDGLDLRNFEVTIDRELSVDRVGSSCCDTKVIKVSDQPTTGFRRSGGQGMLPPTY